MALHKITGLSQKELLKIPLTVSTNSSLRCPCNLTQEGAQAKMTLQPTKTSFFHEKYKGKVNTGHGEQIKKPILEEHCENVQF